MPGESIFSGPALRRHLHGAAWRPNQQYSAQSTCLVQIGDITSRNLPWPQRCCGVRATLFGWSQSHEKRGGSSFTA